MTDDVQYTEIRQTLEFGSDGVSAERVIEIAGADVENLIRQMFNRRDYDGETGSIGTFVANVGYHINSREWHPDHDWLWANSVSFEAAPPEDPPHSGRTYDKVWATIRYKSELLTGLGGLPIDDPTLPETWYMKHNIEGSQEVQTLPGYAFQWEDDNAPMGGDVQPGRIIPTFLHRFSIYNAQYPPWTAMYNLLGCVNDGAWYGADDQTLLFTGWSVEPKWGSTGAVLFDMQYTFIEKRVYDWQSDTVCGWNHFYRSDGFPEWQRAVNATSGGYAYPTTTSFIQLFQEGSGKRK